MSSEEKRRLGTALTQLSPDDLNKALLIVAQNNPNFQATAEEVDLDIDAQVILFLSQFSLSNISIQIKHPRYDYILDFLSSSFFLFLWVTNRTKDILTECAFASHFPNQPNQNMKLRFVRFIFFSPPCRFLFLCHKILISEQLKRHVIDCYLPLTE